MKIFIWILIFWLITNDRIARADAPPAWQYHWAWDATRDFNDDTIGIEDWYYGVIKKNKFSRYLRSGFECENLDAAACGKPSPHTYIMANQSPDQYYIPGSAVNISPNTIAFVSYTPKSTQCVKWTPPVPAKYSIAGEFQSLNNSTRVPPMLVEVKLEYGGSTTNIFMHKGLNMPGDVFSFSTSFDLVNTFNLYFCFTNNSSDSKAQAISFNASVFYVDPAWIMVKRRIPD
jgi:hypothetical protein